MGWPIGRSEMYEVTITVLATGYVFNYAVSTERLREFLSQCGSVLRPGEALTYRQM